MDIKTICKVISCIGILQRCSLYHVDAVDGILFQVPEMVEWSQAEQTCQKNNGKLFKPKETSLDMSLFSEYNFNDDVWVAATYINVLNFESASMQSDSVIRCEMCTIGDRCETTCFYKGCWNRCIAVCKYLLEPYNRYLSDSPTNWIEAKQWCSKNYGELGDKIQNVSSLFRKGICNDRCLWTRNVIQVYFQTTLAQGNEPGECGILHNGTISFTSCNRCLHPLCERVDAVDGIIFQVPEMVEWSQAEKTCHINNGKLFKPKETSFDVSLFSECNFNDDLWVAATYINVFSFESASMQPDSVIRCEMCTIGDRCETNCLYKACGNRCRAVCKIIFGTTLTESHNNYLSDRPTNWIEAKHWCSDHFGKLGDKIENASSLFPNGICNDRCLWTRNVIQVYFQTTLAQGNESEECGILHNGTLSFTSCNRHLHPLCVKVTKTAFESPRLSFSEGNNSCKLMNNKITAMTTTEALRRTNQSNETIKTSSTYGAISVANDIVKHTTFGLKEENSSLLVPVVTTTSRNDLEFASHKPDTGIIIGAVTGSFVFLMMTFLGIICIRRGHLQRIGGKKSKHDGENTNMHNTDIIDPNQSHDVPLETGSGFTVIAQLESNREGSHTCIVGTISDLRKPASLLDPEGSKFNYETLTRKINVNPSNSNSNIDYDGYEHLNSVQERRDDNLTGDIYDTVLYE